MKPFAKHNGMLALKNVVTIRESVSSTCGFSLLYAIHQLWLGRHTLHTVL